MQYRKLLNSQLKLSEIGLGCASYWGKKHFSEKKAADVVNYAIDHGINYFDTGHSYSGGYAEIRLGNILRGRVNNNQIIISSKVGTRVANLGKLYKDFSASWIKQSCEQSLRQLNTDHLPLFFLHGPNPEDFNDEVYRVLEQLKQTGKVGMVGVNAFDDGIIELAVNSGQFNNIMLDFNILTPQRASMIKSLKERGMNVMVAGAIAGGLYDHRFKKFKGIKSVWYWLRAIKNNRSLLQHAKSFSFLNQQSSATAVQLALAYVLKNQYFCSALIGTTSVTHLAELITSDVNQLSEELLSQIESAQVSTH